jgi:probable HAF family extracellular repeat protein
MLAVALFAIAIPLPARGAIIYESATLGPTGLTTGAVLSGGSFAQFVGARFAVSQTELVSDIGGHLGNSSGTLFGAIVSLSSPTALPTGSPFSLPEVVASTTFNAGTPSSDFLTPLSATLNPGEYALVFGSGQFGAGSTTGFMPTDNTDLPGASYFTWNGFTSSWQNSSATGLRFEVKSVPEPSTVVLIGFAAGCLLLYCTWYRKNIRSHGRTTALGKPYFGDICHQVVPEQPRNPLVTRMIIAVFLLVVATLCTSRVSAGPAYTVTDLGTLGGTFSYAYGINNSGQITGYAATSNNVSHAFLYGSGSMQDLGTLGGTYSFASGINDSGQVVGEAYTSVNAVHAFLYSGGSMQDLGTLGGTVSDAKAINNSGQVVGYAYTSFNTEHAFLYSGGSMQDLGTLGGMSSGATGINASGQVVGSSQPNGSADSHAFLYSGGSMQDLGTLGGTYSFASGNNDSGQVVGRSQSSGGADHAFLFSGGSMQDLGGDGVTDINNNGQAIGYYHPSGGTTGFVHAFLYSGSGSLQDLNNMIAPGSGLTLVSPSSINDLGQIVGTATNSSGTYRAFLLMPTATVSLGNISNATIITGGTATVGTTLTNSAGSGANKLNYTLRADVQSGTATLGSPTLASGSLAPSLSQLCTISASSTNLGVNTISFTASDPNSSNGSQSIAATLTVLDHSAPAFVSGGTTLNLDFGTLLAGSGYHNLSFQIQNLLAPYRADLDLDSVTAASNPQGKFITDIEPFHGLPSGSSSNLYDMFLNTSTTGDFTGQYLFNLSDQKDLAGHAGATVLTMNLRGSVSTNTTTVSGGPETVGGVQGTFNNITSPGTLTSNFLEPTTPADLQQALGAVAAGEINFALPGSTVQLWDLAFSGSFSGDATVTLHFDPSLIGNVPLSSLQIEHFENGSWVIPSNQVVDPINDTITFTTDSFSPFALSTVPEPSTLVFLGIGAISLLGYAWRRRLVGVDRA